MPYIGAMENELIIPFDSFTERMIAVSERNLNPVCTCDFYKHRCHTPECARRKANQDAANRNAMANAR
jgi:hypothetical protein